MASRSVSRGVVAPITRRLASTTQLPAASSSTIPRVPLHETSSRIYTERKTFLYNYYSHIFQGSELVLLFHHANLSTSDTQKLRRAIFAIPVPPAPFNPISPSSPDPIDKATLTIARTGILSAISKTFPPSISLKPHLSGPTALISSPSLSPLYLSKLLATITRTLKSLQKEETKPDPKNPTNQPTMTLVAGVLEGGRLMAAENIVEVGKLPELDSLRAQVVGMLEGQGRNLVGLLGQAAGGGLVRTLQGLEMSLKDGQNSGKQS